MFPLFRSSLFRSPLYTYSDFVEKFTFKNGSFESTHFLPDKFSKSRNNDVGPSLDLFRDWAFDPGRNRAKLLVGAEVEDPAFDEAVGDGNGKKVEKDRVNPELQNDKTTCDLKKNFLVIV